MSLPAVTFTLLPVSHIDKRKVSPTSTRQRMKLVGLTYINATVINPADPKKRVKMEFLVDSGAMYSVVPRAILRTLGIRPCGSKEFTLADGTKIIRKFGNALFVFQKTPGASPVIFGEKGDTPLLGMVSLEALGYILDPFRRELRPLPMVLG
jgi:clan AA aspartic protease